MAKKNDQVALEQVTPMGDGDMPTPVEMVADAIKETESSRTRNGHPLIYEAISAVMRDIGAVGKNARNSQQGFMYRGIDAVMNALNPAMVKNKVFVAPEVIEQTREERKTNKGGTLIYSVCKIQYTFYTVDGSSITSTVFGDAMYPGYKSMNKAMSAAFKYACFQTFCIPTEELIDPDTEVHEAADKTDDQKNNEMIKNASTAKITAVEAATLKSLMERKGVKGDNYGTTPIADLTGELYTKALAQLNKMPDVAPKMEEAHEELPFE